MNKTIMIAIVVAILAGAIMYLVYEGNKEITDTQTATEATNQRNTTIVGGDGGDGTGASASKNNIALAPTETGQSVVVDSVTLTKPGFVVIYRVNSNNETEVIGNSDVLLPGTYSDMTVQLDSIIALEQTIVAVLHEDDGDGEFEFPESDFYLSNADETIVSDADVVDVASVAGENAVLRAQVETYLEDNFEASSTAEVN